MYEYCNENNMARAIGTIAGKVTFNHSHLDEDFYSFVIKVPRLSAQDDEINVTASSKLLELIPRDIGTEIEVAGQYRSYNNYTNSGSRLILTLFAQSINPVTEETDKSNPNTISLNGYLCKPPVYRTTPFGREITDILLAVNRSFGKSDYIPCIVWGRNAKYASALAVSDNVKISGRMQSRQYQKHISEDEIVTKTAYEISVSTIEKGEEK